MKYHLNMCPFYLKYMLFGRAQLFFTNPRINSLDPDQDRCSVSPDLGPTVCKGYKQRTKVPASKESVKLRGWTGGAGVRG